MTVDGGTSAWTFTPTTESLQPGDAIEFHNAHGTDSVVISSTNVADDFTGHTIVAGATYVFHFRTTGARTISATGGTDTCVVTVA